MLFNAFSALVTLSVLPLMARAAVWDVTVGGAAGLVYTPPYVNAAINDTVRFTFNFNNHTVTQSAFDAPCTPLLGGVNTGFNQPVSPELKSGFPTFDIIVQNPAPFWIYCAQTGHCPMGMVFAINPPATGNTFDKFKAKAIATAKTTASSTASNKGKADCASPGSAKWGNKYCRGY
ncbi:hypothetical protein FRB94_006968 [Tulasnella sp. JGI-2019a]|nr:hypothetical protein FRB94_006968 [Tulasnella sp. JGI-2019a]